MYDYILLRSDEKYTEYIDYKTLNEIISTFDNCASNEYGNWCLNIKNKIVRIEAINCDKDGKYNFDYELRKSWRLFNLIEINIPEMINTEHETEITKITFRIAEKINWEIYDHETDKVIREKKRPTTAST